VKVEPFPTETSPTNVFHKVTQLTEVQFTTVAPRDPAAAAAAKTTLASLAYLVVLVLASLAQHSLDGDRLMNHEL
jgi:hypothetical protein